MFTQSFDAMETPSDVPAWVTVIVLAMLALTWAAVTYSIDQTVASASAETSHVAPYESVRF